MLKVRWFWLFFVACAYMPVSWGATVTKTVKADGTGEYSTIQLAIDSATGTDEYVIYLEPGTYYTWQHGTHTVADGYDYYSIRINKSITLTSESSDTAIIDGDDPTVSTDGFGSVILISQNGKDCTISNLTIQHGNAINRSNPGLQLKQDGTADYQNRGGGIGVDSSEAEYNSVDILYCKIQNNHAAFAGGGICHCAGNITQCTITENTAYYSFSYPIDPLVFYNDGHGGGVALCGKEADEYHPDFINGIISHCIISQNGISQGCGGGIYGCWSNLYNCTISENNRIGTSLVSGAGVYQCNYLEECDILNNNRYVDSEGNWNASAYITYADSSIIIYETKGGGAVAVASPSGGLPPTMTLVNCDIIGNGATITGGVGGASLIDCTIKDNYALQMGGGANGCNLSHCTISGNKAGWAGGLFECGDVNWCMIQNNMAEYRDPSLFTYMEQIPDPNKIGDAGGIWSGNCRNCIISDNTAYGDGGGTCGTDLTNCLVSGNTAGGKGGGIYNINSSGSSVLNSTIVNNTSGNGGGGLYVNEGNPTLYNNVIWGNSPSDYIDIFPGTLKIHNSCFAEAIENDGYGNINDNPLFASEITSNFRLLPSSPCVDTGATDQVPSDSSDLDGDSNYNELIPWDLDERTRIVDGPDQDTDAEVDMGAYELQYPFWRWPLNAPSTYEGLAVDEIDNRNDGMLKGGPERSSDTGHSTCLSFGGASGADDYITIPNYKGVTGTGARSCCAWINIPAGTTGGDILSWGMNLSSQKWRFRVTSWDQPTGALRIEVQDGYRAGSTNLIGAGWVHVAVVLEDDGDPNISEAKLYVNGIEETYGACLPRAINTSSDVDVEIGCYTTGAAHFFNGTMDDVRIYECALSAGEIGNIMNNTNSRTQDLAAHWDFEEESTNEQVLDDSGNGRHGLLEGYPAWILSGKAGGALQFDGIDDFIQVNGSENILTGASAVTVSLWIKTDTMNAGGNLVTKGISSAPSAFACAVHENAANRLRARYKLGGVDYQTGIQTDVVYSDEQWHHLVFVIASGDQRIYFDGSLKGSSTNSGTLDFSSTDLIRIGAATPDSNNWTPYFNGSMDDVRIYNRTLTSTEVGELYNSF